jgi:hypothetical protein
MYVLAAVTLINTVFRPQSVFMCLMYPHDENRGFNGHNLLVLKR